VLQSLSRWKRTILIVSALLAVGLFASRHIVGPFSGGKGSVGPVAPDAAGEYVGQRAEVCGAVAEVVRVPDVGGKPTFVNLGGEHPDQAFTAVIWAEARRRWDTAPEELYRGRSICVTGIVERHEGTPQIVVSSPRQIRLRRSHEGAETGG
jgi:hypothetical protein